MEKSRKKEILENLCCKEIIFAFLCIIACVTVIRTALGLVETNVGALAILVLLLSAPPARRWCLWLYAAFVFEAVALAGIGIAIASGAAIDVVAALNLSNLVMMGLYIIGCIGGTAAMSRKNDKSKKPAE